ncbi:MAG: hypothetical protein ACREM8_09265, partial [Vulcanimicrobiaceae bacterium]
MIDKFKLLVGVAVAALMIPVAVQAAAVDFGVGTQIFGTLEQPLNTKTAHDGEKFTIVTASHSVIHGHLSEVVKSSISHKAHMKLN